MRHWGRVAAAVLLAGSLLVARPAVAAATISVDNLTPYQLISPGSISVAGHTTGSPSGESVRVMLQNQVVATAAVGTNGDWRTTFDAGPLDDGLYTLDSSVPDQAGTGRFSVQTPLWVDQDPADVVLTSPAAGSTVAAFDPDDGLVLTGRLRDPANVNEIWPIVGPDSLGGYRVTDVSPDGTFRIAIPARFVPSGPQRVGVVVQCRTGTVCHGGGQISVDVETPPAARLLGPTAGLVFGNGTTAVSFGLLIDNPGPGDTVSALLDGMLPVDMLAPDPLSAVQNKYWATLYVPRLLGAGRHTLHVSANIRGHAMPIPDAAFTVDLTPPTVPAVSAPATGLATDPAVTWVAQDDAGIANYDVRLRTASATSAASAYVYPPALQHTTATRAALPVSAGYAYCWSVRARDLGDATSAWSGEKCALTPYDDRWFTYSKGSVRRDWPGWYRGTVTSVPAKGSVTHAGVTAGQVGLVAQGCPTCGSVRVTLGGLALGTVSLKRPKSGQVVVWMPAFSRRTGNLVLNFSGPAALDGVYLRR